MMNLFKCTECGLRYVTTYHAPSKCPRCWARSSGFELGKMAQGLIDQVGLLEIDLKTHRTPALDAAMIKRLLQLCHPDKHDGSQAAIVATQWLLEQREATR